jgi:hypothetical protein
MLWTACKHTAKALGKDSFTLLGVFFISPWMLGEMDLVDHDIPLLMYSLVHGSFPSVHLPHSAAASVPRVFHALA